MYTVFCTVYISKTSKTHIFIRQRTYLPMASSLWECMTGNNNSSSRLETTGSGASMLSREKWGRLWEGLEATVSMAELRLLHAITLQLDYGYQVVIDVRMACCSKWRFLGLCLIGQVPRDAVRTEIRCKYGSDTCKAIPCMYIW